MPLQERSGSPDTTRSIKKVGMRRRARRTISAKDIKGFNVEPPAAADKTDLESPPRGLPTLFKPGASGVGDSVAQTSIAPIRAGSVECLDRTKNVSDCNREHWEKCHIAICAGSSPTS